MPIQPNTNKESHTIFANRFPIDDEDTFLADAAQNRQAAAKLYALAETMTQAEGISRESLGGDAGELYHEITHDQRDSVLREAHNFDNLAGALEAAASNIASTKANMNHIDYLYHTNMAGLQEWGFENGVPQYRMTEEREKMINQAMDDVVTVGKQLSVSQDHVHHAVENGIAVKPEYLVQLRDGADIPDAALPEARGGVGISTTETATSTTSATEHTAFTGGSPVTGRASLTFTNQEKELTSLPETGSLNRGNPLMSSLLSKDAATSTSADSFNFGNAGASSPKVTDTHTLPTLGGVPNTTQASATTGGVSTGTAGVAAAHMGVPGMAGAAGTPHATVAGESKDKQKHVAGSTGLSAAASRDQATVASAGASQGRLSPNLGAAGATGAATGASGAGAAGGAGMVPMGGMMPAAGAPAGGMGASGVKAGKKSKDAEHDEDKKLISAGYSPDGESATELSDKVTVRETPEVEDSLQPTVNIPVENSLALAMDNADSVEYVSNIKDIRLKENAILCANLWKAMQATGWEGAVSLATFDNGNTISHVYATEHLVSYAPHSLELHNSVVPLDKVASDAQFLADILPETADNKLREFAASSHATKLGELVGITFTGHSKPGEDSIAKVMDIATSSEISKTCPVAEHTLTRDFAVESTDHIKKIAAEYASKTEKNPRKALVDMFLAGSHDPMYPSLLLECVYADIQTALDAGNSRDLSYLVNTVNYVHIAF